MTQVQLTDSIQEFREKTTLISNYVGDPALLLTDDKFDVVFSLNDINLNNNVVLNLGDLQELEFDATNLVDAVNYTFFFYDVLGETEDTYDNLLVIEGTAITNLSSSVGDITLLETTDKTSVVNAINEVNLESSAVFEVETYPSLTMRQFVGSLVENYFIIDTIEDYFGIPYDAGLFLTSDLAGKREWSYIPILTDYYHSLSEYGFLQETITEINLINDDIVTEVASLEENTTTLQTKIPGFITKFYNYGVISTPKTIDCSLGDIISIDCTGGSSFNLLFSNFRSGTSLTLNIMNATGMTLYFPPGSKFPGGVIPTWTNSNKLNILFVDSTIFITLLASY